MPSFSLMASTAITYDHETEFKQPDQYEQGLNSNSSYIPHLPPHVCNQ
jgi:hypothetical protein